MSLQIDWTIEPPKFDGSDINQDRDTSRLTGQLERILEYIRPGHWVTLEMIAHFAGAPEASVSAQLRNLRKARFGSHVIEKRYVDNGLYEYRFLK